MTMFPKKATRKAAVKRWMIIVGLSAGAVLCGSGCRSLQGNPKEIDFSIFGIGMEVEFWEPVPIIVTNLISQPRLMERTK